MKPAARVGDMHTCPMATPVPHVGGPVLPPGGVTVLIGGMPAARMGDMCTCVGPPDVIVQGAMNVLICGQPAARMGDMTAHGGIISVGCPTVLIGMSPGGGSTVAPAVPPSNSGAGGSGQPGEPAQKEDQKEDKKPKGIFDDLSFKFNEMFGVGAKQDMPTLWSTDEIEDDDGEPKAKVGIAIGAEYKLEDESYKTYGDKKGSFLSFGNYEAKAATGYGFDLAETAAEDKHSAHIGVEGKASVVKGKLDILKAGGLAEANISGEALSISGKFNLLKVEHTGDTTKAVAEVGAEAILIKGEASGQVNITPKTVYDNTLGRAVNYFSPAHAKAPEWLDHGIVVGAKGEAGIGAAAEASVGVVRENGVTGFTGGAKVGAGPVAGLKLLLGVK